MDTFAALTKKELRKKLQDYYGKCMYRITQDGEVHYYGNPSDICDRSADYWHYLGQLTYINNAITRERKQVWSVR